MMDRAFHQLIDMGDVSDFVWHFIVAAEERGITLRVRGVVAMHRTDRALAHVAGNDESPLLGEPDHHARGSQVVP